MFCWYFPYRLFYCHTNIRIETLTVNDDLSKVISAETYMKRSYKSIYDKNRVKRKKCGAVSYSIYFNFCRWNNLTELTKHKTKSKKQDNGFSKDFQATFFFIPIFSLFLYLYYITQQYNKQAIYYQNFCD